MRRWMEKIMNRKKYQVYRQFFPRTPTNTCKLRRAGNCACLVQDQAVWPRKGLGALHLAISSCSQDGHLLSYCGCSGTLTTLRVKHFFSWNPTKIITQHLIAFKEQSVRESEWMRKKVSEGRGARRGERKRKQKTERCTCGIRAVSRLNPLKLKKYEMHVDSR